MTQLYLVLETFDCGDFNVATVTPDKEQAQELLDSDHVCLVWENGRHFSNMDKHGDIYDNPYDSKENSDEPESGNIYVIIGFEGGTNDRYVKTVTRSLEFAKEQGYEAAGDSAGVALIKEYNEDGKCLRVNHINSLGLVY